MTDRDWKEYAEQWDEHEPPTGIIPCIRCATVDPMMPPHNPSPACVRRPSRPHCDCAACFG